MDYISVSKNKKTESSKNQKAKNRYIKLKKFAGLNKKQSDELKKEYEWAAEYLKQIVKGETPESAMDIIKEARESTYGSEEVDSEEDRDSKEKEEAYSNLSQLSEESESKKDPNINQNRSDGSSEESAEEDLNNDPEEPDENMMYEIVINNIVKKKRYNLNQVNRDIWDLSTLLNKLDKEITKDQLNTIKTKSHVNDVPEEQLTKPWYLQYGTQIDTRQKFKENVELFEESINGLKSEEFASIEARNEADIHNYWNGYNVSHLKYVLKQIEEEEKHDEGAKKPRPSHKEDMVKYIRQFTMDLRPYIVRIVSDTKKMK